VTYCDTTNNAVNRSGEGTWLYDGQSFVAARLRLPTMKSDCLQVAGATIFESFLGYMVSLLSWCLESGSRSLGGAGGIDRARRL